MLSQSALCSAASLSSSRSSPPQRIQDTLDMNRALATPTVAASPNCRAPFPCNTRAAGPAQPSPAQHSLARLPLLYACMPRRAAPCHPSPAQSSPANVIIVLQNSTTRYELVGSFLPYQNRTGGYPTLRMQLQPVVHCSSLNALDPGSGR